MITNTIHRERKLAVRVEEDSATGITYVGSAKPGTLESEAKWQIQKIEETVDGTTTTTVITYPDGANTYSFVWSDRASLTYS